MSRVQQLKKEVESKQVRIRAEQDRHNQEKAGAQPVQGAPDPESGLVSPRRAGRAGRQAVRAEGAVGRLCPKRWKSKLCTSSCPCCDPRDHHPSGAAPELLRQYPLPPIKRFKELRGWPLGGLRTHSMESDARDLVHRSEVEERRELLRGARGGAAAPGAGAVRQRDAPDESPPTTA